MICLLSSNAEFHIKASRSLANIRQRLCVLWFYVASNWKRVKTQQQSMTAAAKVCVKPWIAPVDKLRINGNVKRLTKITAGYLSHKFGWYLTILATKRKKRVYTSEEIIELLKNNRFRKGKATTDDSEFGLLGLLTVVDKCIVNLEFRTMP